MHEIESLRLRNERLWPTEDISRTILFLYLSQSSKKPAALNSSSIRSSKPYPSCCSRETIIPISPMNLEKAKRLLSSAADWPASQMPPLLAWMSHAVTTSRRHFF